jgi:hypothetical protein
LNALTLPSSSSAALAQLVAFLQLNNPTLCKQHNVLHLWLSEAIGIRVYFGVPVIICTLDRILECASLLLMVLFTSKALKMVELLPVLWDVFYTIPLL